MTFRFFLPLVILTALTPSGKAQEGIRFTSGAWAEILSQAKTAGKPVFVDAYTTWCGPCRMMSRQVFPEPAVGDLYNDHFINVKIDMEAREGIALARHYEVEAFPTLLFVDGEGRVLHRAVGFHNVPKFLELGRTALDPERRLSAFRDRYEAGDRDPEFLHDYALIAFQAMEGNPDAVAGEYLRTQDDWSSPKNMRFIFTFVRDVDSDLFDYLAAHRPAFEDLFGSQAVISRIQSLIMEEAFSGDAGPEALEKVDALFAKTYPEVAGQLSALFRINYFQYTGDTAEYARATISYFDRYPSDDPMELNNAAWNFYELVDNRKLLAQALKWAERSIGLDPQYYNHDTLAALYAKLGKKKRAVRTAETAIELAKVNGEDYGPTQLLLEELQKN